MYSRILYRLLSLSPCVLFYVKPGCKTNVPSETLTVDESLKLLCRVRVARHVTNWVVWQILNFASIPRLKAKVEVTQDHGDFCVHTDEPFREHTLIYCRWQVGNVICFLILFARKCCFPVLFIFVLQMFKTPLLWNRCASQVYWGV